MKKITQRTVLCLGFPLIFAVFSVGLLAVDIFFNTVKLGKLFKTAWDSCDSKVQ